MSMLGNCVAVSARKSSRALSVLVALLPMLMAAPAAAAPRDGLQVACDYWQTTLCGAKITVVYVDEFYERRSDGTWRAVPEKDGEVRLYWMGERFEYIPNTIWIRRGLPPVVDCDTKVHEIGHLVLGRTQESENHTGRMARVHPAACLPPRIERVADEIRQSLPRPASWQIICRRGRCTAKAPWAKKVRRYAYTYIGKTRFDWRDA